jgi:hypothetical protein
MDLPPFERLAGFERLAQWTHAVGEAIVGEPCPNGGTQGDCSKERSIVAAPQIRAAQPWPDRPAEPAPETVR